MDTLVFDISAGIGAALLVAGLFLFYMACSEIAGALHRRMMQHVDTGHMVGAVLSTFGFVTCWLGFGMTVVVVLFNVLPTILMLY